MKSTILLILPIAAFVLLLSSGCSVLAPFEGRESALGDVAENVTVPNAVALRASDGDRLQVHMGRGVVLDVIFHKLTLPDMKDIIGHIADQGKETASDRYINPGDRVRLRQRGGKEETGVLLGASTTDIWYRYPDEKQLQKAPFRDLASVQSGKVVFRDDYLGKVDAGQLPPVYDIWATLEGDSIRIPLHKVDSIVASQSSPAAAEAISTIETVHNVQFTLKLIGLLSILAVAFIAGASGG